jgi:hypothetical protein
MERNNEVALVLLVRAVRRGQKKHSSYVEDKAKLAKLERELDAVLGEYDSDRDLRALLPPAAKRK